MGRCIFVAACERDGCLYVPEEETGVVDSANKTYRRSLGPCLCMVCCAVRVCSRLFVLQEYSMLHRS